MMEPEIFDVIIIGGGPAGCSAAVYTARTSHSGIFAAGDVTDDPYKQNNISAGDGVRAALACYAYLQNREKLSPASEHLTNDL